MCVLYVESKEINKWLPPGFHCGLRPHQDSWSISYEGKHLAKRSFKKYGGEDGAVKELVQQAWLHAQSLDSSLLCPHVSLFPNAECHGHANSSSSAMPVPSTSSSSCLQQQHIHIINNKLPATTPKSTQSVAREPPNSRPGGIQDEMTLAQAAASTTTAAVVHQNPAAKKRRLSSKQQSA